MALDYGALDGLYVLGEEIGSGGFGKVKLAIHLLTKERVAIKIIDKKAIGDDLPRVTTELRALQTLQHQHICRLYQFIETENKFFIVLEHCSGGELFDYIVKKECLAEPEARHFFRQILSAIAYVHQMGFAHRDLKPENLLLTDDLQLKLIDFGLCANPETGLNRVLETCCGSPAYAAPELIMGKEYFGNEADVWSMGVLLFALLCGYLPFEDDNIQALYQKISRGEYKEPNWLSAQSRGLLKSMLTVDPRFRIKVSELLEHPWVIGNYAVLKWKSIYDPNCVDEDCVNEMAYHCGQTRAQMTEQIKKWDFGHYDTATYLLLLARKRKDKPVVLPISQNRQLRLQQTHAEVVVRSPTIHASLDTDLNRSGLGDGCRGQSEGDDGEDGLNMAFHDHAMQRQFSYEKSYAHAIESGGLIDLDAAMMGKGSKTGVKPRTSTSGSCLETSTRDKDADEFELPPLPPPLSSMPPPVIKGYNPVDRTPSSRHRPRAPQNTPQANRENIAPSSERKTANNGNKTNGNDHTHQRAKSVYHNAAGALTTPRNHHTTIRRALSPNHNKWARETPFSAQLRDANNSDASGDSMRTPVNGSGGRQSRTPRSSTKSGGGVNGTPRFGRRVFASVERKVDRVINLLTPGKRPLNEAGPNSLKHISPSTLVNVSTTSTDDPVLVLNELVRVLTDANMCCEQIGWKVHGKCKEHSRRLSFELEVVYVQQIGKVGVRRKRLQGDAMLYKRVCEHVLNLASL